MRRVVVILLQEKNFGPNVIYNVFVTGYLFYIDSKQERDSAT